MPVSIYRTRDLRNGKWQVIGLVDGRHTTVVFELDEEPTIEQCAAALEGKRVERVLREPAAPPAPNEAAGAPTPAPAAAPLDPDVDALLEGNVAAVSERVATVEDRELLERARQAEEANKGRSTAIAAIDARLAELTATDA